MGKSSLPAGSTFSKDPRLFGVGFTPTSIVEGIGSHVLGDDGRWYTDFISGLGSILLGHRHPEFCRCVAEQVWLGTNFSLVSHLERKVADKLVAVLSEHVPGWHDGDLGVRFVLSGSDACEAALRLARKATGHNACLVSGYHGWHAPFCGLTPPAWGVNPDPFVVEFPYGDLAGLEAKLQAFAPVAAVILEVLPQEVPEGYWDGVRHLCDQYGALLVVDEVVTGWRLAMGGACEHYRIVPDLCCFAKAMSNGVPFGAVVGKRALFDHFDLGNPVFVSGTGLGHSLGLAACDAVLDLWTPAGVARLWNTGRDLMEGLTNAGCRVEGIPPRFLVQFDSQAQRAYFIKAMAARSVLCNRPWLVNAAHSEDDVTLTVEAAGEVMAEMQKVDVEETMRGKLPAVLFANR